VFETYTFIQVHPFIISMKNLKHKILLVLVALTIIGEVASIILWTANPIIPTGEDIRYHFES
jgi:hypothetical protein